MAKKSKGATWARQRKKVNGMTEKAEVFVREFTIDWNKKRAAEVAGYKFPAVAAHKLLQNPEVQKAIRKIQKKNEEKAVLTRERIIQELSNYAMFDFKDLEGAGGQFLVVKSLDEIPPHVRRCVTEVEVKEWVDKDGEPQRVIKCKVVSKVKAVELMMQHLGMFAADQHDVRVSFDWWGEDFDEDGADKKLDVIEGRIAEAGSDD